jgi:hypothetical protein
MMFAITPEQLADPRLDLEAFLQKELAAEMRRRIDAKAREEEQKTLHGDPDAPNVGGILATR